MYGVQQQQQQTSSNYRVRQELVSLPYNYRLRMINNGAEAGCSTRWISTGQSIKYEYRGTYICIIHILVVIITHIISP